jgi:murein DD-endopeptidase MepM/ murein hydrolase activator NlpD
LYTEARKERDTNLIEFNTHTPKPEEARKAKGTYLFAGASVFAVLSLISSPLLFPKIVDAFWPFTEASGASESTPILHDTTLALLEGASNPDPNPYKGEQDIEVTEGSALIPNTGPEGTLPEGDGIQNGGRISVYVVREGDTLSEIADMFGVSPNTIKWANDITDVSVIQPGKELLILPVTGVRYTIKRGGTLSDVAKLFNADVEEIALFNGIEPDAILSAGTELIVPGGELAQPKVAKKRSGGASYSSGGSFVEVASDFFINPLPGSRITQGLHGHNSIDVGRVPLGSPVVAAAGGRVLVSRADGGYNGGYGNYVVIDHGNGMQTLYAHLSSVSVSTGESVAQGDALGGVGSTGRSTGVHLHFEVRGGKNPLQ